MAKPVSCFFGLHSYEVLETNNLTDVRDNVIGKVIVSRCKDCGKLKNHKVETVKYYMQ